MSQQAERAPSIPDSIQIRQMTPHDIPAAMRLKEAAGWNQVEEDWEAYMRLEPRGCFVADLVQTTVATATTLNYEGRFGWIGMVIVDPAARRRGVASRMMERAISYLDSVPCVCRKLDATDAGARVYQQMGFVIEYAVERWVRPQQAAVPPPGDSVPGATGGGEPLVLAHLPQLAQLDTGAFGASRAGLLEWYASRPCQGFVAGEEGARTGFVAGRRGSKAWQMGPLVARDASTAERLMQSFLAALPPATVIADIVARNHDASALLRRFGFTRQRVLQRMYRGENLWPGRPAETFCLAGFEFG